MCDKWPGVFGPRCHAVNAPNFIRTGHAMQPYEFGYRVGLQLEKRAVGSDPEAQNFGQAASQFAFGTGDTLGQLDPMQRGMVQEMALYSNPFTGVPTAINDVSRHLYNGRFMDAGIAGLSGALSFLPGAGMLGIGGLARGATKGLVQGGRTLARAGAPQLGKTLARGASTFGSEGAKLMAGANKALSSGIQRVAPLAQNPGTMGKYWNAAVKNPMQAAQYAPLAQLGGTLGMAAVGAGGGSARQQNFQPAGPAVWGGGQAGMPLAGF